jgi:ATP-dependent DNA helicase RecQ
VIDILLGRPTAKVSQHRHDGLSVFGVGTELSEGEWRGVVRQLLAQGLLAVEGDYGTLALTPASGEVLGQRRQVPLRRDPERQARAPRSKSRTDSSREGAAAAAALTPEAKDLFEQLRSWRGAIAREQGLPAYVIFHDATLRQIAAEAPATLAGLATVNGVGEAKLAKYGQQVLDTIAAAAPPPAAPPPAAPTPAAQPSGPPDPEPAADLFAPG